MLYPDVISKVHLEKWKMEVYVAGSDSAINLHLPNLVWSYWRQLTREFV